MLPPTPEADVGEDVWPIGLEEVPMSGDADVLRLAMELETRRAGLLVSGDVEGLAGLLSEHLYYAHSTGLLDSKGSFIEKFRNGTLVFRSVNARVESVAALGEQAFQASGVLELQVQVGGAERFIVAIYIVIWRQENGIWQLIGHQATAAPSNL
ncbi:nuclear transport factor 2 family protein [Streptomyces sp. NPDC058683]|uniref:nuclear transport factor 2 family protein n=1 Tax=Streptomyces sp. NPDC058683 TaxID=3346597 RepID=UPI003658F6E6